jgi:hypothetical protein
MNAEYGNNAERPTALATDARNGRQQGAAAAIADAMLPTPPIPTKDSFIFQ